MQELRPDERIVLENLHRAHPRLVTNLAGVRPRAVVERAGGGREEVGLICDTLWIDSDRGLCTLVWRGRLGLSHPEEAGRVVVWAEGADVERGTAGLEGGDRTPGEDRMLRTAPVGGVTEQVSDSSDERVVTTLTAPLRAAGSGPALPFTKAASADRPVFGMALPTGSPALAPAGAQADHGDTLTAPLVVVASEALPFRGATGVAAGGNAPARAGVEDLEDTVKVMNPSSNGAADWTCIRRRSSCLLVGKAGHRMLAFGHA